MTIPVGRVQRPGVRGPVPWLHAGALAVALVAAGCATGSSDDTGDGSTPGPTTDAPLADAQAVDTAPPTDGAAPLDVGVDDAGGSDGGPSMDTGTMDAGAPSDTGVMDAGTPTDTGVMDAAVTDVGAPTDTGVGTDVAPDAGELGCPAGQTACGTACVNTLTDPAHCGGCGQPCTVANGTPVCHAGVCSVAGCSTGYGDCDGRATNGCETAFAAAGTCGSGTDLGAFCADQSCGFLCPGTSARAVATRTAHGGQWFHARANECSDCLANLEVRVTLASPAGVDYDLFIWAPCGTLLGSSRLGAGAVDSVVATHTDSALSDESFDYFIEVRYVSGSSCAAWTLTVDARGPSATSC